MRNNYAIFDSEIYFIKPFYIFDFMYDNKTSYLIIGEVLVEDEIGGFIKKYFKRKGGNYIFVYNSQVLSKTILDNMKKRFHDT